MIFLNQFPNFLHLICMTIQYKIYFLEMLIYLLQTEQTKIKLLRRVREEERRKQLIDLIFARR